MSTICINNTGASTLSDLRGNHKMKETKAINMIGVEEKKKECSPMNSKVLRKILIVSKVIQKLMNQEAENLG